MKLSHPLIVTALLLLPLGITCYAADQEKPAEPMKQGGMSEEQQEQHLKAIQEQSLLMHDLSNQILAEKDSAKKEQLKKQQRDLMKAYHAAMMQHHPRADMH